MTISAQDVLLALFNPQDTVCFRVFDDKKNGVFSGAKLEMEAGKYATIEATLKSHNEKNRGIFFVVNHNLTHNIKQRFINVTSNINLAVIKVIVIRHKFRGGEFHVLHVLCNF